MLMVGVFVSKCPTSQLIDVCSGLNEHLSEESGEHRNKYANHIFTSASFMIIVKIICY